MSERKHKEGEAKILAAWASMMQRCYDHRRVRPSYSGKSVCQGWHNRNNFVKWATEHGLGEAGMQIDRIDTNKGYKPSNCRVVSAKQNMRNTRRAAYIEGIPAAEYAEKHGVSAPTAIGRARKAGTLTYPYGGDAVSRGNSKSKYRAGNISLRAFCELNHLDYQRARSWLLRGIDPLHMVGLDLQPRNGFLVLSGGGQDWARWRATTAEGPLVCEDDVTPLRNATGYWLPVLLGSMDQYAVACRN